MNKKSPFRFPPRLSMDEYAALMEKTIREANPEFVARQKAIEKSNIRRFVLIDDSGKDQKTKA